MVIELKASGDFWQVTHDGEVIVCAIDRRGAINAIAGLLRSQLKKPAEIAGTTFIGLELSELLASEVMDPNWKRKGPRIEVELFEHAEGYLQTELRPADEEGRLEEYHAALEEEDFDEALDCLVDLGEWQACTNPFWKVVERLAESVWTTDWMMDRRAKGKVEARIADIKRRARGYQ